MAEKKEIDVVLSEIVRRLNEQSRRIRTLESRNSVSESRTSTAEDTILKMTDEMREKFKTLSDNIKAFETLLLKLEHEIGRVNKNIEKTAKKSELRELENIISLYNPIKSKFITKEEMESKLKEMMM